MNKNNKQDLESKQDKEYFVEKIIGKRVRNGIAEYRVKWEGFALGQSTWEPAANLSSIQALLDSYENKIAKSPRVSVAMKSTNSVDQSKEQANHSIGLLKNGDGKITLQGIKTVKQTKEGLCAVVYYEENGVVKKGSFPTSELRERAPDLLIDFYESKIKFAK